MMSDSHRVKSVMEIGRTDVAIVGIRLALLLCCHRDSQQNNNDSLHGNGSWTFSHL